VKSFFSDEKIGIEANASELHQVYLNLRNNANQSIEKDGEIIIKTGYAENNTKVKITISDNGVGTPLSGQHRIYELFFTTK